MTMRRIVVCDMCQDKMNPQEGYNHIRKTIEPFQEVYTFTGESVTTQHYDLCRECWEKILHFAAKERNR